jgi:hypothetical protein
MPSTARRSRSLVLALALSATFAATFAVAQLRASVNAAPPLPKLEIGVDRSNMGTEWTLSPPSEPNIYPFNGPYNGPGVFEARRTAIYDGIARLHPQWFRDGFGTDTGDAPAFVAAG